VSDDPGGVVLRRDGERVRTAAGSVTYGGVWFRRGASHSARRDALVKHTLDLAGPVPPGLRRDAVEVSWRLGSHEATFRVVDREEVP
jgi:hypothetical protein